MWKEFKEFIAKGNVLDLSVAVLLGAAFGALVKSFTEDILTPIIGLFGNVDFSGLAITIGNANIKYGLFINALVNFLIVAGILFLIVKAYNRMKGPARAPEAVTKDCPYCLSTIPKGATRCPACTSELSVA